MEKIRRVSMAAKRPDTLPESTPRLNIRSDRYAPLNFSVERTKQCRNPIFNYLAHFLRFFKTSQPRSQSLYLGLGVRCNLQGAILT